MAVPQSDIVDSLAMSPLLPGSLQIREVFGVKASSLAAFKTFLGSKGSIIKINIYMCVCVRVSMCMCVCKYICVYF